MRLTIEGNAESEQKCDFCDPILIRSQVKKGVPVHTAYELLSKDEEDISPSKSRIQVANLNLTEQDR